MNTKQKYIDLLRSAANLLQSADIQDELIAKDKIEFNKAVAECDMCKAKGFAFAIEFHRKRKTEFLTLFANTMQQIIDNDFMTAIAENFPESNAIDISDTAEGKGAVALMHSLVNDFGKNVRS